MKLRQAPPAGKVKCPKCNSVVPVRAAAASSPAARPVAAGRTLDPDDEGFDFGRINFPSASGTTAVSHFPVADNVSVYDGPIPGDPLEQSIEEQEGVPAEAGPQAAAAPAAKKKNPMVLVGALAAVGVLLVVGIVAATQLGGGGGDGGGSDIDILAAAQSSAPSGYRAVGIEGVVVLMPKGMDWDNLPSLIESMAIESSESGSVYFMGAMDGGNRPLDKDQMRKKAERQLGGEILGGQEMERNGYKGIKGILDGSIFLPRMMVEVFHVEERFVILGCAPRSLGADPSVQVDRQLEQAEQKIFYGSFKVGPKPSGWLW
jgi:hypothetical protein